MILEFKNINPCNLLDKIKETSIDIESIIVTNNRKLNEITAENTWVECKEQDVKIITNIAENLDNTPVMYANEQQILNANLLQQNASLQLEIEQQKQLNAQILLQLAGGITNV